MTKTLLREMHRLRLAGDIMGKCSCFDPRRQTDHDRLDDVRGRCQRRDRRTATHRCAQPCFVSCRLSFELPETPVREATLICSQSHTCQCNGLAQASCHQHNERSRFGGVFASASVHHALCPAWRILPTILDGICECRVSARQMARLRGGKRGRVIVLRNLHLTVFRMS